MEHANVETSRQFLGARRRAHRTLVDCGAALVLALSLLALFTTLGTLYVLHMNIELDAARYQVRGLRAHTLAEAGMRAALADLERAIQTRRLRQFMREPHSYDFPTYRAIYTGDELALEAVDSRRAGAVVTVLDESGKVNLNHVPASVLQAVLGVDGATARRITSSLPRTPGRADPGRRWLLGVEDLLERGLLTEDEYEGVNPSLVTTHTVIDHRNPRGFLNINAAPAEVLAAVLDVRLEVAEGVAAKPLSSLSALLKAIGKKDAATFNIRPDYQAPDSLPQALSFNSRCFRLVCESTFAKVIKDQEIEAVHGYVEAVVLFDERGEYEIVRWSTQRKYEAT